MACKDPKGYSATPYLCGMVVEASMCHVSDMSMCFATPLLPYNIT